MSEQLRISVVVASRARPEMLARCLGAIDQLIWPAFEVIVVADKAGRDAIANKRDVRIVACDQANIALARNLGIAAAGGDVIAFIDDDAVPEPMWLAALAAAFSDGAVGAATGPVLGRNGISLQSGAETILATAETVPADTDPARRRATGGRTPKTVGTNMAFRADLLRSVGGFDESYRYLFEDADLNVRLGAIGVVTAYLPDAVVHHSRAPSKRRRQDRTPRDLFDIGRSTAVFLSRHAGDSAPVALDAARHRELARIDRALVKGTLEPRDARRLRKSFEEGVAKAFEKDLTPRFHSFDPPGAFHPRPPRTWTFASFGSGVLQRSPAIEAARTARDDGAIVTLMTLSRTGLYHSVRYEDGMWVHRGGAFGRSDRAGPLFRLTTRKQRFHDELARVSGQRGLNGAYQMHFGEDFAVSEAPPSFF